MARNNYGTELINIESLNVIIKEYTPMNIVAIHLSDGTVVPR